MSDQMVSAGEAARRLGVAPATIQRWVDSGVLHAERTPGGHRRIYVTELRRLIAASRPVELSGLLAEWCDVLMAGDPAKVKAALIASRQKTGNWADTADEVAAAIAEIGRRWEAGDCRIFEEHAATEACRTRACRGRTSPGMDRRGPARGRTPLPRDHAQAKPSGGGCITGELESRRRALSDGADASRGGCRRQAHLGRWRSLERGAGCRACRGLQGTV
jgi:excisionase family DNA binding protein